MSEFALLVLYGQLHVANPAGAAVALQWTEDEVAQGFAWDEALVAFGVPDHDGECLVRVETGADAADPVAADALWAVAVPFTAAGPTVSVGTVAGARDIPLAAGRYRLVFQARPAEAGYAYRLQVSFALSASPEFTVLRQGELDSDRVLQRRSRRI